MFKKQLWLTLLMLLALGLLLIACGGEEEVPPAEEEAPTETETETEEEAEPETMGYAGETIEIIVPYGEGGGSDTWTRALAPFLQKYLGDDVTIQVINMPGASGTLGANEFANNRDADGLTLLNSSGSNALPYILGGEGVEYDFAQFTGVMGSPVGGVVYVSADTGITDVAGLCDGSAELIYGGISPTGLDLVPLMAFDLMGVEYLPILGYDGRGAARVAMEQGEINLDYPRRWGGAAGCRSDRMPTAARAELSRLPKLYKKKKETEWSTCSSKHGLSLAHWHLASSPHRADWQARCSMTTRQPSCETQLWWAACPCLVCGSWTSGARTCCAQLNRTSHGAHW